MNKNRKLGIIGGMGARAGAFFLQRIIDYSPAVSDQEFLDILFHNNAGVPDRTKAIVYNEPSPLPELLQSVKLFNTNRIEVMAMACITAYYYYDEICRHTSAMVINPLHLIAEHIRTAYPGAKRIGLLATTGTIRSGLFHDTLCEDGMEVITLQPGEQETLFMRAVYMKNGFKSARVSPYARNLMQESLETLKSREVDVIIGGCTEVSTGIDPSTVAFPYIDALDLLARGTVACCYNASLIKQ